MQSIKVMNDLLDCIGNGLVIGTHNVTVDLNGHTIDGTGIDAGIVNMGFDSVTITNGTLHEFDYGVLLNPGSGLNVVKGVHVELNQEAGIALADADEGGKGNIIRENTLTENGEGILLLSGTKNAVIRDNAIGGSHKDGVRVELSIGTRIEENEIAGSGGNGVVLFASANNTVIDNEISLSSQMAVSIGEELLPSNNNVIKRNTISDGGGGVSIIDSSGNEIALNVVRDVNGPGVAMELGRNNTIKRQRLRLQQVRNRDRGVQRQHDREQQRQRHPRHRHRDRLAVDAERRHQQHGELELGRGHRDRGLGADRPGHPARGRTRRTATAATASTSPASATPSRTTAPG